MKELRILGFGLLIITIAQSCSDDLDSDYNPIEKLERDIQAIDQYIATNNLTVEIDEDFDIRYIIDKEGDGERLSVGDSAFVDYDVFLLNGTFIGTSQEQTARDNSAFNANNKYEPFVFVVGANQVITGFEVSALLLKEGGSGTFFIPSVYAYQQFSVPNIPPNSSLLYKISIVEIR